MRAVIATFLLVAALFAASTLIAIEAVGAVVPQPADSAAETSAETRSIAQASDAGEDTRIAERIEAIFAEIPALGTVSARVSDGVVTLSGTVGSEADSGQAVNIAGRVSGVVTVQNEIERDTSVAGGLDALSALSDRISGWIALLPLVGLALLVALVIGGFGYVLASFSAFWRKVTPNVFLAELVASALRFIFVVIGLVIALDMLGAGALLGAVLGGAGVVGIALGFAMRDTIENYVASLMLSLRQPFRANDHVLIDDLEGRVIRLTTRATVLMTLEGNHLRIPNGQVFKAVILNYTRNPQRRFEFVLGVDADDDAEAARCLGRDTLRGLAFVLDEPAAEVRISEVGDSNVVLQFLGWIDQRDTDWHKAKTRAIAACKVALEDAGFALPEPIYRLRFDQRTAVLPFQNIGEGEGAAPVPAPAPKPAAPPPPATADDVKPDDEIARMVESERNTDSEQDDDLLDAQRPVE